MINMMRVIKYHKQYLNKMKCLVYCKKKNSRQTKLLASSTIIKVFKKFIKIFCKRFNWTFAGI